MKIQFVFVGQLLQGSGVDALPARIGVVAGGAPLPQLTCQWRSPMPSVAGALPWPASRWPATPDAGPRVVTPLMNSSRSRSSMWSPGSPTMRLM